MRSILEEILESKQREVALSRELYPTKLLEGSIFFHSPTVSLVEYLTRSDLHGIIAEIKRQSPSKGLFAKHLSVEKLSLGYMQAGASALSILTDKPFFGGTKEDLQTARRFNYCPILRKDFIIDEYQIVEAKSIGADVILLIAAALSPEKTRALATAAHALGLEVLLEVHSAEEIEAHVCSEVDLVGVNNRNLSTFSVSIDTSFELAERIPNQFTKISESGISTPDAIKQLKALGYRGFLIGEAFMSNPRPEMACRELIEAL